MMIKEESLKLISEIAEDLRIILMEYGLVLKNQGTYGLTDGIYRNNLEITIKVEKGGAGKTFKYLFDDSFAYLLLKNQREKESKLRKIKIR